MHEVGNICLVFEFIGCLRIDTICAMHILSYVLDIPQPDEFHLCQGTWNGDLENAWQSRHYVVTLLKLPMV
jgi:hypothetical protein